MALDAVSVSHCLACSVRSLHITSGGGGHAFVAPPLTLSRWRAPASMSTDKPVACTPACSASLRGPLLHGPFASPFRLRFPPHCLQPLPRHSLPVTSHLASCAISHAASCVACLPPSHLASCNLSRRRAPCPYAAVNYISKPTEFVDTFFMFANGKPEQASLLHVSHHIVMPIIIYADLQYPGGNCATGPFINSVSHTGPFINSAALRPMPLLHLSLLPSVSVSVHPLQVVHTLMYVIAVCGYIAGGLPFCTDSSTGTTLRPMPLLHLSSSPPFRTGTPTTA